MRNSVGYIRHLADPTYDTHATAVPKFKLAYPEGSVPYLSQSYFTIKSSAVAQPGADGPILVEKPFVLDEHQTLVKTHTQLYKEKSAALAKLDKKIMAAVLFALVAMYTPFIPFVGMAAIAAWMAALHWTNQRATLYNEYYDSLLLLVATCSWCLGPTAADDDQDIDWLDDGTEIQEDGSQPLLEAPVIKTMMDQLYLVLSKPQLSHLLSSANWVQYQKTIESHDNSPQRRLSMFFGRNASQSSNMARAINQELESPALKQRSSEFIRCVYGLNRGSSGDFLRMFIHAVPDLCYAAWHTAQAACTTTTPALS
ncbi:MAG: hypothetical protein NXI01_01900 [Gammaproteobacteria bacterium]|nr:hypothetical protein [Gammaproteobacteria bacterium]